MADFRRTACGAANLQNILPNGKHRRLGMPSPEKAKCAEQAMQHYLVVRWLAAESYTGEKYCDGLRMWATDAANSYKLVSRARRRVPDIRIVHLVARTPVRACSET
jgi:hypothetical protein